MPWASESLDKAQIEVFLKNIDREGQRHRLFDTLFHYIGAMAVKAPSFHWSLQNLGEFD